MIMKSLLLLCVLACIPSSHAYPKDAFMVTSIDANESGIVAKIFLPECSEPRPAIIVLSGSDGGFYESVAQLFAEKGFVALALAYFNADGLPKNLENIPLEYFLQGIHWLQSQPYVKSDQIHLYGPSRGGELVLLLASTFPDEFSSVVAVVPSCVTYGGVPNEKMPSWTLAGKPIPAAPSPSREDVYQQLRTQKAVNLAKIFLAKMQNRPAFEAAMIKVENIRCPVLLISGKDDKMWPSSIYGELIMQRLDTMGSSISRQHLCYEMVGHVIVNPLAPMTTEPFQHPVTKAFYEVGGEPEAQAAANKDSWDKLVEFFLRCSHM